jgi:membrane-associated phospholipid phosphatase
LTFDMASPHRSRIFAAATFALVLAGSSEHARAQVVSTTPLAVDSRDEIASDQVPLPPPKRGRFKFLQQVVGDFKHLPSRDSFYWLAGGGALALAVHPQDDEINQRLIPHETFFNPGQTLGSVYVQSGGAFITYVIGRTSSNEKVKHLGTDMLSAQIVAQAVTVALKVSTRRERPDGSNKHSFPSGHASTTFATATVLQRHLGWRAAVPTYTLATYVAMSRLQENRHFLSDVVFGSALGIVAGRTTTRHGRAHWAFIPDVSPGRVGFLVSRLSKPARFNSERVPDTDRGP